ncbi:MAG: sugar ABC transporter ATP-binding protein [Eubacterium sp.]|nr:sugar ABC transporter ATP-binding protein [Eubacterium sp.]
MNRDGKTLALEMKGVSKSFGGVQALSNVSFQVIPGEIHALMGENGAGKSTLMKLLGGVYTMTSGTISVFGEEVHITNPIEAAEHRIGVVYQEQSLVDSMTVADNILMGRIPNKFGWIDKKKQLELAKEALDTVQADVDLLAETGTLPVSKKQFVEIAKAISLNAEILVMDEPTSVLTMTETEHLFKLIRRLQAQGVSIIYISHRMEEIFELCDRCTVLKDGTYVDTVNIKDIDRRGLVGLMTGRTIADIYPKREQREKAAPLLEVKGLTKKGVFSDVSFQVEPGEIMGMYGLVGSGRSEVCRSLMAIDRLESGEIFLKGEKINIKKPREAIEKGIIYISEDRKYDGLFLRLPIETNISISTLKRYAKAGFISNKKEQKAINEMMKKLQVKAANTRQVVSDLSGGNQQKVMLAMWILVNADVMIVDEPTRGVDVGTKIEIYRIIRELADAGTAVIMISSELPEVLGCSDRIVVMHEGKIAGELPWQDATEENVLLMATGGE